MTGPGNLSQPLLRAEHAGVCCGRGAPRDPWRGLCVGMFDPGGLCREEDHELREGVACGRSLNDWEVTNPFSWSGE
jgi:hypothetical protein